MISVAPHVIIRNLFRTVSSVKGEVEQLFGLELESPRFFFFFFQNKTSGKNVARKKKNHKSQI